MPRYTICVDKLQFLLYFDFHRYQKSQQIVNHSPHQQLLVMKREVKKGEDWLSLRIHDTMLVHTSTRFSRSDMILKQLDRFSFFVLFFSLLWFKPFFQFSFLCGDDCYNARNNQISGRCNTNTQKQLEPAFFFACLKPLMISLFSLLAHQQFFPTV